MSDVVERAREALAGITAGEWVLDDHEDDDYSSVTVGAGTYLDSPGTYTSTDLIHEVDTYGLELDEMDYNQIITDARFIAAAPQLVADLLSLIEEQEQQIARLKNYRSLPDGYVWQDYYSPDEVMKIRREYEDTWL